MSVSLDELFDGSAPQPASYAPLHSEQDKPAEVAAEPAPQPEPEPPVPEAQPGETAASQDKGAPPAPEEHDGRDPAFGRLRKERNDYREQLSVEKVERARLEERLAAHSKELETLRTQMQAAAQQRPAPQPQQPPPMPNPVQDPAGYAQWVQMQASAPAAEVAHRVQNALAWISENNARRAHGQEAVNEARKWFDTTVKGTPLEQVIRGDPDPWQALVAQHQKVKALAEIGDDPAAFRTKLEADLRAKLEQELQTKLAEAQAAQGQVVPARQPAPAPNLPPSLGKVPSAGARSGPAHTGPASIQSLWGE